MTLSRWTAGEVEAGGWVRRGFDTAQRLRAEHGDDAVADLSLGQPLEATAAVRQAFADAAADRRPRRHGYMPNLGYPEVRDRVAEDVAVEGMTASGIAMTGGAAGAISLALRTFLDAGDEVVASAPYFSEFRLYAAAAGLALRVVPSAEKGGLDLMAIGAALSPRTGALIVNSPCNPSGHVVRDVELAELVIVLEEHRRAHGRSVLLIVDEVYRNLVYPPHRRAEPFQHWENSVLARSFSKDLGIAGERIGYLAVHPSLVSAETERGLELCQRALGYVNAPATAQLALLNLRDWSIDRAPYQARRDAMTAAVTAAGLQATDCMGGLYLWVRSPWPDTMAFCNALSAARTVVVPGIAFGVGDHFRICFSVARSALPVAAEAMRSVSAQTRAPN
ncbi:MAG: aminotransferase class I/II-fold pyridoxal phosphate-dependent enzyme [Candidatus Dormibacteria bacterium]